MFVTAASFNINASMDLRQGEKMYRTISLEKIFWNCPFLPSLQPLGAPCRPWLILIFAMLGFVGLARLALLDVTGGLFLVLAVTWRSWEAGGRWKADARALLDQATRICAEC